MTQTAPAHCARDALPRIARRSDRPGPDPAIDAAIDARALSKDQTTRTYWQIYAAIADFARDTGNRPAGIQIDSDLTCDLRLHNLIDHRTGPALALFGLPIAERLPGTLGADRYRLQTTADIHKREETR